MRDNLVIPIEVLGSLVTLAEFCLSVDIIVARRGFGGRLGRLREDDLGKGDR